MNLREGKVYLQLYRLRRSPFLFAFKKIIINNMKACFMGLGYIGLPTAIIAAKHGVQVTGVDINPKVVEMTNQGHLHIIEPGMEEMLQEVVKSGALKASTTPEVSDAYFMVVPTPFKGNHEPDISYV